MKGYKKITDKKKRVWLNPVKYFKKIWKTYSIGDEYYYKETLDKNRNLIKIKFKRIRIKKK